MIWNCIHFVFALYVTLCLPAASAIGIINDFYIHELNEPSAEIRNEAMDVCWTQICANMLELMCKNEEIQNRIKYAYCTNRNKLQNAYTSCAKWWSLPHYVCGFCVNIIKSLHPPYNATYWDNCQSAMMRKHCASTVEQFYQYHMRAWANGFHLNGNQWPPTTHANTAFGKNKVLASNKYKMN